MQIKRENETKQNKAFEHINTLFFSFYWNNNLYIKQKNL
jgi:hypothetical protein